jgi:competence protein ComEC
MAGLLLWIAIPAVSLWRAFLMTALPGLAWLLRHEVSFSRLLLCIGCLMVLADPLIWLDLGAWFSWWATLLLLLLVHQIKHWKGWKQLVVIQLSLAVLLMPIHAVWQLPMFPSGMVLNLILIPWVSFVSLPLAFLTGLGVPGAAWLFNGATEVWRFLLQRFDHLILFLPHLPPIVALVVGGLAGWGLITAWRGWYWLGWLLLTSLLIVVSLQSPRYAEQEFGLWILDSGRGQAVIIETSQGRVLVDLGAGTGQFIQLEQSILRWSLQAPFGSWHSVVLTRPGRFTQGGLTTLASLHLPPQQAFAARPPDHWPVGWPDPQFCGGNVQWQLGGVTFRFLRPHAHYQPSNPNAGACVLEITSPVGRALLLSSVTLNTAVALQQSSVLTPVDLVVSQGRNSESHQGIVAALNPSTWVVQSAYEATALERADLVELVCTCGRQSWFVEYTNRGHRLRNSSLHLIPWLKLP